MKRVVNCPSCSTACNYDTKDILANPEEHETSKGVTRYYNLKCSCGYSFMDTVFTPTPFEGPVPEPRYFNIVEKPPTTFPTGAKRGSDEVRYDLLQKEMLLQTIKAFEKREEKYGQNLANHAVDHLFKYLLGDKSEDHLGHALANLVMLRWMEVNKNAS